MVEVVMVGNFVAPATVAAEAMVAACLGKLYPALVNSEYRWRDKVFTANNYDMGQHCGYTIYNVKGVLSVAKLSRRSIDNLSELWRYILYLLNMAYSVITCTDRVGGHHLSS